jgi:peptidoglycan/xylan/chitin deacetylase (PgdA/CDA1 family)
MMPAENELQLKRLMMLVISGVFLGLLKVWQVIHRLVGVKSGGTCVVLYYHQVRREHRAKFARQMDMLLHRARPARVDRNEPLDPSLHHVAVTFDDGYENVFQNALPELQKRNIPSTMFVITEALGKYPDWLSEPETVERVMSPQQLLELPAELVTVGSHTMTHPSLPSLSETDAKRELFESRTKLETMLNRKIKLFSFPYGGFNANLVEWCRESGYERVFTILPTPAFADPNEFVTGRVSVEPTDWPLEFQLKLMGAYRWLPAAYSLKRRILAIRPLGAMSHVSN